VTAADVATETGLPSDAVTRELNTIAWETGGHLQVSASGAIAYIFQPGFSRSYLSRGAKRFAIMLLRRAAWIGYRLLRISFGFGLILSLGFITLITLPSLLEDLVTMEASALSGGDDKKKGRKKTSPKAADRNPQKLRNPGAIAASQCREIYAFCLKCFSFLFGDSNPLHGLDERRWRQIAMAIRAKDYALTADELAPYTGTRPDDDSAVLPVLVRFNGCPQVTETGNIIYVFSSLSAVIADDHGERLPTYFEEPSWTFSKFSAVELQPVKLLAGLNLLGSWSLWCYALVKSGWHLPALLLNLIVLYGTGFIVLPLARMSIIQRLNKAIAQRNELRSNYAKRLQKPKPELRKKLAEASQFKLQADRVDRERIVYSTDQDSRDQPDELDATFKEADQSSGAEPRDQ